MTAADPVGILHATMQVPSTVDLNLISVVPGGVGAPVPTEGRALGANGEAVVDRSLGIGLGETLRLASTDYKIVGRTSGVRFNAGTPAVFITVKDAQKLVLDGLPLSSAIILKGHLAEAPEGLKVMTNAEVLEDLRRPLDKATSTISFLRILLWIIAAGIIGSVLYLQALERTRDFAVFKATGVSSRSLMVGIAMQAIILAALSAVAALLIEAALAPTMDLAVEVPTSAYIALPIVAVVVGLLASLFGLRRAVTVDPALGVRRSVMEADLAVRDLVIEYSSGGYPVRPIDGLDLDAASGQLVLLLGASGCGKTTLLSVLAAILKPTSGSVRIGDTEVTDLRGAALTQYRRHTVGIVFQAFNLVPSLSALENVMVPLRADGLGRRASKARSTELLERVDLGHRLTHRPGGMSGGQQQRVAIARALAHDPPVILADEPTAHLDYIQVEGVLKLVRELADDGRLVVVATHDERLIPLADSVVNLTPRADTSPREPEVVRLDEGQVLFKQAQRGDLVYMVDEGKIEIIRTRDDGTEERLAVIGPGNYFGELAPMFGLQRSATARAVGPTVVTGYGLRDFRDRFHLASPKVLADAAD